MNTVKMRNAQIWYEGKTYGTKAIPYSPIWPNTNNKNSNVRNHDMQFKRGVQGKVTEKGNMDRGIKKEKNTWGMQKDA